MGDAAWGREVLARSYHLVSANLALRTVGISPYEMSPRAREITALASQAVFRASPKDAADFVGAALGEVRPGHPARAPVQCC